MHKTQLGGINGSLLCRLKLVFEQRSRRSQVDLSVTYLDQRKIETISTHRSICNHFNELPFVLKIQSKVNCKTGALDHSIHQWLNVDYLVRNSQRAKLSKQLFHKFKTSAGM